jgi:hypothetical protein
MGMNTVFTSLLTGGCQVLNLMCIFDSARALDGMKKTVHNPTTKKILHTFFIIVTSPFGPGVHPNRVLGPSCDLRFIVILGNIPLYSLLPVHLPLFLSRFPQYIISSNRFFFARTYPQVICCSSLEIGHIDQNFQCVENMFAHQSAGQRLILSLYGIHDLPVVPDGGMHVITVLQ